MKDIKLTFIEWLPIGLVVLLLTGLIYGTMQQYGRMAANDIPEQLTLGVVNFETRKSSTVAQYPSRIDLGSSVDPFIVTYDANKNVIRSTATLHNKELTIPHGVLDDAKKSGINKVTWQPEYGVRVALVVQYFKGSSGDGWVAAGQSLRFTAERADALVKMVAVGGTIVLLTSFGAVWSLKRSKFN